MNVLAIESSGPIGSVAACRDDELLVERVLEAGMEHGRMLVPLVDRVIQEVAWDKRRDIDLICVSQGPGSFTGLRVGVCCAKTLATLLNKPLVGICSLDAMAENAPHEYVSVLTALDAKRDQLYVAAYERCGEDLERKAGPVIMSAREARDALAWPVYVLGDALKQYPGEFQPPGFAAAPEELWRIRASVIARLGLEAFRAGRTDEPVSFQPVYLRLAEAEEKRLARERKQP
jgi:tRNA threonylcarbamoyladenosine biosynthesis protein TsaB